MAVDWNDQDFIARIEGAAFAGVVRAISIVDNEATRLIMRTQKSGKVYRRRGVKHQASAPGEAPASDTGALIQSKTTDFDRASIAGRLSFRTNYALALEKGTLRMAPRPYAVPAIVGKRTEIIDAIVMEIGSVLR